MDDLLSSLKCKECGLSLNHHTTIKAMQIALRDHTISLLRATIDNECQRATPRSWSAYINASTVIKELKMLVERLNKTI